MKIIIFGANGKLGKLITQKALDRGHDVRAFVRDKTTLEIKHVKLEVVEGDIYKPETVEFALEDQEAIISAIGGNAFNGPLVCRDAIEVIIPVMHKHKVKRLIAISAFGASEHKDFSVYTKMLRIGIPLPMHDKDEMEKLVEASGSDWTLVRPAAYTDVWPKKSYRASEILGSPYPVATRNGVAECMLDQLDTASNIRKAIAIEAA